MPPQFLSTLPRNKGREQLQINPIRPPLAKFKNVPKPSLIVPPPKVDLSSGKPSRIPILKRYHSAEKHSLESNVPVKNNKKSRIVPLARQRQIYTGFNKTTFLTRPRWHSGNHSQPETESSDKARVPVRGRRTLTSTHLQHEEKDVVSPTSAKDVDEQDLKLPDQGEVLSNSTVDKRKPVLIEKSFDTFPRTPVPLPRTISLLTNRPTPKPRKFSLQRGNNGPIIKNQTKRQHAPTPAPKDATWPRKNSINLRPFARPRFFSDDAKNKVRPMWLPVGSKNPPKANEIVKRRSNLSGSFRRGKIKSSSMSRRRFQRNLNKDKVSTVNKDRLMPASKFNVSLRKTKAKMDTFNRTQFNKFKKQFRSSSPTKNVKAHEPPVYKKRSLICETNGKKLRPTKIPTPIFFRKNKKTSNSNKPAETLSLKRKRNSNNSNEINVIVEKDSYSPLYVKPIHLTAPAKRQSNVSSDKPKVIWLPPGRAIMQQTAGGNLERRLSRIPIMARPRPPKSRIAWLPASRYTRLQSYRDYARCHPEALQPFQITV